ncbi:MAG: 3-oxoacyl-ACP reductase FabG, partial [SAR324 cluster bacterium]|nr:3-oxoacyl-ACP reductase FabG [SAR324 cluster bacterium]
MDFNGKTALITGAARGIGKTIALQLAAQGADIAFTDLSDEVEVVKSEIESQGRRCLAFRTNVTDGEAVDAMVKEIVGAWERIDILINNAGITRDNLFLRMKPEEWSQVMDINLNGVFNVTRAVVRPMVKQRFGRVVSLSSVVGFTGNPGQVNYSSTKAALVGFTKSLAREVGVRGVTVNLVAPGFIDTAMTQKLNEEQQATIIQQVPLGRMGSV